jgi:hypothetical protein
LREGYPFDGRNVTVPRPAPSYHFPDLRVRSIVVSRVDGVEFTGSGFGHKRYADDRQYYSWLGQEIPRTAFEIAVKAVALDAQERRHLVTRDEPKGAPSPESSDGGWVVLFRSDDPSVWNTDSADKSRFAITLTRAPREVRYLRLRRMDTGEMLIVPITYARLKEHPRLLGEPEFGWDGAGIESHGGVHLGIAQGPAVSGPPGKHWPRKGPKTPPPSKSPQGP